MSYVAVDLETTGLDPSRDRVIEVGAVTFTGELVTDRLSALADPGRTLPDAVRRLTGIDPRSLHGQPPSAVVLERLTRFMSGSRPVGHGSRLEVGFLSAAGHDELGEDMLDTLDLARILLPRAPSHSLPELARDLGLTQPNAHRALDDADATRQLLLHLVDRARALPPRLLERMRRLCEPYPWRVARFFREEIPSGAPHRLPPDGGRQGGPPRIPAGPGRDSEAGTTPRREAPQDPARLAALLGPDGPLARAIPGFEHREGQVQMLLAVAQAMQRGRRLVVEAGTGTGKSLAYLIPAAARAVARKERVVVATHTHTLQEQLLLKDVPALRAWLPWD
ncbi:MAG: exonuclease domain-containing protein, partial [Candidatus Dormibacteraceae bacterium]